MKRISTILLLLVTMNVVAQQQPCPCGGTPKNKPKTPGGKDSLEVITSNDPNEIIGPEGVPDKRWVSVKDRLPYTILCENDKSATAPAKYVKIVYPIADKQDISTFYLGSFGFNNQTFTVPPNSDSYYQRLDCRDSLGLYVDVTAGLDVTTQTAFWQFQSIDPSTLLPPEDPLKGLLLLQDSAGGNNGHAFVNFSIKPDSTAVTLDSIRATAYIIFDSNDTIPTNVARNTIDAFAPTSSMNVLPSTSNNPVSLSWGGTDDHNGCGLHYYTLYVSTDGINFSIIRTGITRTDTTFSGIPGTQYYFFVLATDSVGNTETLRPLEIRSTYIGAALPLTWLYFNGINQGKNNLLKWATASEQDTREYKVERSLDGNSFVSIGSVTATGSSNGSSYQFTDHNIDRLNSELMYYRIKQIDRNGAFKYSGVVRLSYREKPISIVYPNPARTLVTLVVSDAKLVGSNACVFDESGRLLKCVKIMSQSQSIDLSAYMNGVYYIRLVNNEMLRIIKLN